MTAAASIHDVLMGSATWTVIHGLCPDAMSAIPDASIDAIVSDPIYPEIDRHYGRISEADWHILMRGVVAESRRVLKPLGSAVFILQPNSERVGRMRPWLWEFMAWTTREWNIIQDAYWWNPSALPKGEGIKRHIGHLRPSVKACVWIGAPAAWCDQSAVLWTPSERILTCNWEDRARRSPHGHRSTVNNATMKRCAMERGGVTPFNLLPISAGASSRGAGAEGHGAGTPYDLAAWWIRYICPPGGVVLDPFGGAGTMAEAARDQGRRCILIEKDVDSVERCHRTMSRPPRGAHVPPPIPGQVDLAFGGSQ